MAKIYKFKGVFIKIKQINILTITPMIDPVNNILGFPCITHNALYDS